MFNRIRCFQRFDFQCKMADRQVHTPLEPVHRHKYTNNENILVDHVEKVDPEVFGIMKNVSLC